MYIKLNFYDNEGNCYKQRDVYSDRMLSLQLSLDREPNTNKGYSAAIWLSTKSQPLTLIEDLGDSQYARIVILISKEEIIINPEMGGQESGVQRLYKDSCGTVFESHTGETSLVISLVISDLPSEGIVYQIIILKNRVADNPTKLLQNNVYQMPAYGWIRAEIDLRI